MKVVLQILSAFAPSMTVIDTEYLYVGPVRYCGQLVYWMDNIQNDSYPIFIVLTDESNISIGRKRFHSAKCFVRNLTILKIWESIV